jgi:hypothetical protein
LVQNYRLGGLFSVTFKSELCIKDLNEKVVIAFYKNLEFLLAGLSRSAWFYYDRLGLLKRRLRVFGCEITNLRKQQQQIIEILKQKQIQQGGEMLSKERWVEIMRAAGLTDEDMHNWHIQFEKMEPEAHQEFLESLGITAGDIEEIRKWSRNG